MSGDTQYAENARRRAFSLCAGAFAIAIWSAWPAAGQAPGANAPPAPAQQADLGTIYQRYYEFYAGGNFTAALIEAQKYEAAIKARFGTNHANYAGALANLARVYEPLARHSDAEELHKRALAIREQALGASHPDVANSLIGLANVYKDQGKYGEAQGLDKRALAIREKALGADHPEVAQALNNLAIVHQLQGNYGEAEALHKRALAIREKVFGAAHPEVAQTLYNLANVYKDQGKYVEAVGLYKRSLNIREQAFGANHLQVADVLNDLAIVYYSQGNFAEAQALHTRILAIREKALGADHPDVAGSLNNLANVYYAQGKYGEAEAYYKRALAIKERVVGADHPDVAIFLNNLAVVYRLQSKYREAEALHERALAIREKALGADHPDVARSLNNLANVYIDQGKYEEAEGLHRRALVIREKDFGAYHLDVGQSLNNLALVYQHQRKYGEAEGLYKRALEIREQALGANHPEVAQILNYLADLDKDQGKYGEAEAHYKRALAIRERALGANHPNVAETLNNLASLDSQRGDAGKALAWSRKATAAVIAHGVAEAPSARQTGEAAGLVEQRAKYFLGHIANVAAAARQHLQANPALGAEGFEMAQWASQSSAAAAIQQMAARFGSGRGALADLVRENQDLAAAWRNKNSRLWDALLRPEDQRDRTAIEALRQMIADTEARISVIATRLEKEFPNYDALTSPRPLNAEEVQKLLGADEGLVFLLTGDKESYVFALTRESFDWHTIPIGAKDLSARVAAFRRGLDVEELRRTAETGNPVLFDLALAHELYAALIGPVEGLVRDKPHLLVVPTGTLTSLPFHLLVTEKPATPVPQLKDIASYRDAAWLIKRQALSVLPSVASLKALRGFAREDRATKPLVGFGDPVFDPAERARAFEERRRAKSRVAVNTRAYSEFWQGGRVDRNKLAQALPSLLDTADELKAVAAKLGAPAADIHLNKDASETTVKRTALADYRVVYFATHGLVAGDVKGLGEPSLALTLPAPPSESDDGLLTASEVTQLKLNADWVVAGEKPGAEALSGLARAFFYAGARALLVTHWSVASESATRLTTSTFGIMKSNPAIGRAEALRRAMVAYMNDKRDPLNAYPAFWGPFSVVGEGEAR
jgi:tetratricopeptide (TPR) repeat protein/CHAT domain-containing protein